MPRCENELIELKKLSDVIRVAAKYHAGAFSLKTCDYLGICPGDRDFLRLLEENGAYLYPNEKEVERFCDEEIQELVKLSQDLDNQYAKMRITKLLEPLINKCYRRSEDGCYSHEDYFMAAVVKLYEYIDAYQRKRADFCFLLKKRLIGLNAELRDEGNPFYHGMGQYLGKIRKFITDFESRYGIRPTAQMIAEGMRMSKISVEHCLWVLRANDTVSLDAPLKKESEMKLGDEGCLSVKDLIPDSNCELDYVESHKRELIIEEVKKLPPLEQAVVFRKFGFFGEPLSREGVCRQLMISRGTYEKVLANAFDILFLTLKEFKDAG